MPLLLFPEAVLPLLGWTVVDPIASRLVGAAFLSIGVESLLGRDAAADVYRAMLNLKILWASGAILGLALGILAGGPLFAWLIMALFAIFLAVWIHYRLNLR